MSGGLKRGCGVGATCFGAGGGTKLALVIGTTCAAGWRSM